MTLTPTHREILLLAAESGGRPALPAPEHIAGAVDRLMQEQMLVVDVEDRVVISDLGRATLAEIHEETLKEHRRCLGLLSETECDASSPRLADQ